MMATLQDLERYYADPRVRAFLSMIRSAEGTSKYRDPYRVAGGGRHTLATLDRYTRVPWAFTQTDGVRNTSTAAGAYQFLNSTWDGLQKQYGFTDFGQRSQDLAAIALMAQNGSLNRLLNDDFFGAVRAAAPTWASLKGDTDYKQRTRSDDFVRKAYEQALGAPVAMHGQYQPDGGYYDYGFDNAYPTKPRQPDSFNPSTEKVDDDPYKSLYEVSQVPDFGVKSTPNDIAQSDKRGQYKQVDFSSMWGI